MSNVECFFTNPTNLDKVLKTGLETAGILGISKQRLGAIKKSGHLQPAYSSSQGDLYLLSDIYMYKNGEQGFIGGNHTKYAIYDLLLSKKNILVVGGVGTGKTFLVETIRSELSDHLNSIALYDFDRVSLYKDAYTEMFNDNKGILITVQGLNAIQGFRNFTSIVDGNNEGLRFDVIVEVNRDMQYNVIQGNDYFYDICNEVTI